MIYGICFIERIIDKTLEELKFCKKFIEYEFKPGNDFEVKIKELIDKIEHFSRMLEEANNREPYD